MLIRLASVGLASLLIAASSPRGAAALRPVTLDGVIVAKSDDTLAFTPDAATVFFDRSEGARKTIMVSHRVRGRWSPPRTASFSGRWFDQDPVVSPDGQYLLFNSDRPARPGDAPLVQTYFSKTQAPGSQIWRVDRKGDGWGEPRRLPDVINSDVFIDFASIAGDGTLYFMRWSPPGRIMQLWRAASTGESYSRPKQVDFGDADVSIHDPAVAPDQSFIVFDYGKVTGGLGRLSIAFHRGAGWSAPIDMGDAINADLPWGAHLSPDARTAYVTGRSGIWSLDLTPWLRKAT